MAKAMKNSRRDVEKEQARLDKIRFDQVEAINIGLDNGLTTRAELAKVAGIKLFQLTILFKSEKEVYDKFCLIRQTIVDIASDNLMDIVSDKKHPKNYDASKHVLTNYKSDLDSILTSKDEEIELEFGGTGKSKASPITIRFGKKRKSIEKEDEE
tara:strand:+ start:5827 stop:6291 length:465 start_codon:yes stop_codon:yes gene_type:complete